MIIIIKIIIGLGLQKWLPIIITWISKKNGPGRE